MGGAFISPLKLIPTTGGVHDVEFPINTQQTDSYTQFLKVLYTFHPLNPMPLPKLIINNRIPDILESNSTSTKLDDSGAGKID